MGVAGGVDADCMLDMVLLLQVVLLWCSWCAGNTSISRDWL